MKVLVVIESYGTGNDKYLRRLVEEYQSMSFDVHLVVISNLPKYVGASVEVIVVPRRKNPWRWSGTFPGKRNLLKLRQEYRDWVRHLDLPFAHKQIFADRLNEYDLFVYSEDDILLTERNLRAFESVSANLLDNEIPGFLRFEIGPRGEVNYPEVHGHFHWKTSSVCRRRDHTLAYFTNDHAACYVATRDQLRQAIGSGGYLVAPHGGKYDLLCTAATDLYTQCGFKKLICISQLDDFLVHHLPNKYVGSEFGVDDTELRRQIDGLLKIDQNDIKSAALFEAETRLPDRSYSKGYYEPVRPELVSEWPTSVQTILSIGTGSGLIESCLSDKGLSVVAIPLDEIIYRRAESTNVEIIHGDFADVRRKLRGRQFDGLLLSNVLHLVPDPVDLLTSFVDFVSPGGTCIAVLPNTTRLKPSWKAVLGRRIHDLEMFRMTGVQATSLGTVHSWFRSAGFEVTNVKQILRPRAQKIADSTLGFVRSWLAYEFVVAAKKHEFCVVRHQAELQRAERLS